MGLNFTPEVTRTTMPTGGFSVPTSSAGSSPYLHTPTRFKRTKGRPGEALSDIATSLVRSVAQLYGQPVLIPSTPDQGVALGTPPTAAGGSLAPSASLSQNSTPNHSPLFPLPHLLVLCPRITGHPLSPHPLPLPPCELWQKGNRPRPLSLASSVAYTRRRRRPLL